MYEHSIEEGLVKLLADEGTTVLRRRPQSVTVPVITYERTGGNYGNYLSAKSGWATATIEFRCWSTTYLDLDGMSRELRTALDSFQGMAWDRYVFTSIHDDGSEVDSIEQPDDGSERVIYCRAIEFTISYDE